MDINNRYPVHLSRAVLVYIHGGSFTSGSNSGTDIDGAAYARKGIITVSVNYRLGAFHNAIGDGYTGYLTIEDQAAALHWVHDNIADYGGNPSKITVMGESAGAISTQNLLASPLIEDGLIRGAIMMSGGGDFSSLGYPTTSSMVEPVWTAMKATENVQSIEDLKSLSTSELYSLWRDSLGAYSATAALPTINGAGMDKTIAQALNDDTIKDVPCIMGFLSEDVCPYSMHQIVVDYARKRTQAGGEPVYLYYFDRNMPGELSGETDFGAYHGADLFYAFGTLYRNWRPFEDVDYRIAEDMINYFSRFVKTGDPNGGCLATWDAATAQTQEFMHFGDDEADMVAPSVYGLAHAQCTIPLFPYADHLNGTPVDPPAVTEKTPISAADLTGTWILTGWKTLNGTFTATSNSIFVFDEGFCIENSLIFYLLLEYMQYLEIPFNCWSETAS